MFINLLDILHPVGSLYMSFSSTSPAETIGGTWTQIIDKCLRAANNINSGGADTITLNISQIPSHNHKLIPHSGNIAPGAGYTTMIYNDINNESHYTQNTGGGQSSQQLARLSKCLHLETHCLKLVMPNGIY